MKPPCSHYQHLYTVIEQQPIPLCLNCRAVLAYESVKQLNASLALILLIEAERLNTIDSFLVALAVAFHHFGWLKVVKI